MKKIVTTLLTLVGLMLLAVPAFAGEGGDVGTIALGAGICMGLAAIGGTLGQSRAAAAGVNLGRRRRGAEDPVLDQQRLRVGCDLVRGALHVRAVDASATAPACATARGGGDRLAELVGA